MLGFVTMKTVRGIVDKRKLVRDDAYNLGFDIR